MFGILIPIPGVVQRLVLAVSDVSVVHVDPFHA